MLCNERVLKNMGDLYKKCIRIERNHPVLLSVHDALEVLSGTTRRRARRDLERIMKRAPELVKLITNHLFDGCDEETPACSPETILLLIEHHRCKDLMEARIQAISAVHEANMARADEKVHSREEEEIAEDA